MAQTFNPKKSLEYTLKVGNFLNLKNDLFGDFCLGYAGMPSKKTFSIIYNDARGNKLVHPISQKEIELYVYGKFKILEVNPEKIKLKYLREKWKT